MQANVSNLLMDMELCFTVNLEDCDEVQET